MSSGDDFRILGTLSLNDQASGPLQNFNNQMQQTGVLGTAVGTALGFIFSNVIMGAINGAIGALQEFASAELQASEQNQVFDTAVANLTGSLGDYGTLVDQLALKTPIPASTLESALLVGLRMGESKDQAMANVTAWGNLAVAGGNLNPALDTMQLRWEMLTQTGTLTTLALRTFANEGVDLQPILESVASKIAGGPVTTLKQMNEMLKDGTMSWDDLTQGILDAGSQVGPEVDAMSDTFLGMQVRVSNLLWVFGTQVGTPILNQFGKVLSPVLQSLTSFAESSTVQTLITKFQDWLQPMEGWLGNASQALQDFFTKVSWGTPIAVALPQLLDQIGLGNVVDWWDNTGKPAFDNIKKTVGDAISGAFKWWADNHVAVTNALDTLVTDIGKVSDWVNTHGKQVGDFFNSLATATVSSVLLMGLVAIGVSAAISSGPVLVLAGALDLLRIRAQAIGGPDTFKGLNIGQQLEVSFLIPLHTAIMSISGDLDLLIDMVNADLGIKLPQTIGTRIAAYLFAVPILALTGVTYLGHWIGGEIVDLAKQALDINWPQVISTITKWLNTPISINLGNWIKMGTDICGGIAQGIVNAAQTLIDSVVGAVRRAYDAAVAFLLHPLSPSPLFVPLGESISTGLAAGISGAAAAPSQAVTSVLAGTASAAAGSAGGGAVGGGGVDNSRNVTINMGGQTLVSGLDMSLLVSNLRQLSSI